MLNTPIMTTLETELEKCAQFLQKLDPHSFSLEEAFGAIERLIDSLESHAKAPGLSSSIDLVRKKLTPLGEKFVSATGMQEEELLDLFDNPKPFPKDKWELAHAIQKHLLSVAKSLALHLSEPSSFPPESKKHPHPPARSNWMRT